MKERIRTGLRIPYEINTKLIFAAEACGISKNALILQILWEWLERNGRGELAEEEKCE